MKKALLIAIVMSCLVPAGGLRADDTEIYGAVEISLKPNVLIIFDTSGSMSTVDVPGTYYDPGTSYPDMGYSTNAVYTQTWSGGSEVWGLFANDINDINCASMKGNLMTQGYASGDISSATFNCGGSWNKLSIGNYLNYDKAGLGTLKSRISVAQEVVTNLINNTENVRFGLMRFNTTGDGDEGYNDDDGGRILAGCGSDKTTLINTVNGFTATGWTPLAETLAEAGLYFAGKSSWYNTGVTYASPIQERCQKNFIILMTDGEPTQDRDSKLTSGTYINGDTIGDYDGDGSDPGSYSDNGSDYLDDVAKYLYENDISPLGSFGDFEKQNIVIYTIGFTTEQTLLHDTAINGGGEYATANNISRLTEAFSDIMAGISGGNALFVSPVVPISRMNRTYAGNSIYVGFFKPQASGMWFGNLKKYGLNSQGIMVDADGLVATTADGSIKDNARSYWSTSADGANVIAGGAGQVLIDQASRNLYTYMGTQADLTHTDNRFSTDNVLITNAVLNVATSTERENVINEVHGGGRSWMLGDLLHSQPAVAHYDTNGDGVLDATYIFAGSNDGMIHCFDDSDGSEVWGFISPDQLTRLQLLLNDAHNYFADGSPVVYEGGSQNILFFGERRGGDHYYALDITSPTAPRWLYGIGPDVLGTDAAQQLGQSWSRPEIHTIKTGNAGDPEHTVYLLSGGYDTNQDAPTPSATDSVGRSVFAVNVTDGTVSVLNFSALNYADMTHCIVDVSGFDSNGDGFMNRAYAGDLGGKVFAFEDDDSDGTWSNRRLFSASAGDGVQRKIFYSPDAVEESFGEMIFFGTGDRADPEETGVENRFYAIKNNWVDSSLTEADLVDVTEDLIQLGTAAQKQGVRSGLAASRGWYIRLENSGEKVISSPIVFGGVVYFTTYTPAAGGGSGSGDPCGTSTERGAARLYAVDYITGASIHNYSPVEETDQETGAAAEFGKLDRSKIVGQSIPSAPVIAVLETGPKMYLGVQGGVVQENTVSVVDMNIFYWRQIF